MIRITLYTLLCLLAIAPKAWSHSFSGSQDATSNPPPELPERSDEDDNCGNNGDPATAGKPVDLFTGAERFRTLDISVPGPFPIRLMRHYDSLSDYDSPLGYGWALNTDKRLYEYADGSVIIRFGCGLKQKFTQGQESGTLYEPVDGTKLRGQLQQQSDGSFVFTQLNGWQETYDAKGLLVKRQRPDGLSHRYTYSSQKYPLVGISPYSIDPNTPRSNSLHYRLLSIAVHLLDDSATGQSLNFAYHDTTGRLQSVSDQAGRSISYQHDVINENSTAGNLIQVTGLAGRISTYRYDDPNDLHNATFIQHSQGQASATITYDANGRVSQQIWGETEYRFSYDTVNRVTTASRVLVTGDTSQLLTDTYTFDDNGRVLKRIYADGTEDSYTFTSSRRVSSQLTFPLPPLYHDADGSSTTGTTPAAETAAIITYDYDSSGRRTFYQIQATDTSTVTSTWAYDNPLGLLTNMTRSASDAPDTVMEVSYSYDSTLPGRLIKQSQHLDSETLRETHYRYLANGLIAAVTLPNGDELRFTYTAAGQVASRQLYRDDAAIAETLQQYTYNSAGFPTSMSDPIRGTTAIETDAQGRPLRLTNALSESTLYSYENDRLSALEVGQTGTGETLQRGVQLLLSYDAYQRVAQTAIVRDGALQVLNTNSYDSLGRLTATQDGAGRPVRYAYDERDRVSSVQIGDNPASTLSYDSLGRLASEVDPLGRETAIVYDRLDRPLSVKDAEGGLTAYAYNALDQVVRITDAKGSATAYRYNGAGELLSETQPSGDTFSYAYDNLGRLSQAQYPRGQVFRYTYTPFSALATRQVYASASATTAARTETFAYNTRGLLSSISDTTTGGEQYRYEHDALGRVTTTQYAYLPFSYSLNQSYTAQGQLQQLSRTQGSTSDTFTYNYDSRSVLTGLSLYGEAITLDYNDALDLTSKAFANLSESRSYNNQGQMTAQGLSAGETQLEDFTLSYNAAFNLASLNSQTQGNRSYTYNPLDRLLTSTTANSAVASETFAYDLVGNRSGEGYSYDANHRLLSAPGLTYTYDADGNLSSRSDGLSLSYDEDNRLTQLTQNDTTTTYQYDIYNRRISKTIDGITQYFVWEDMQLTGEYNASGMLIRGYAYIPGELSPSILKTPEGTYRIHNNYLSTPYMVTDNANKILWSMQTSAYGQALINNDMDGDGNTLDLPLRFPGQYMDTESGFYYNVNRYYDPAQGRYITSDPLGLYDGPNSYTYAHSRPTALIDPEGKFAWFLIPFALGFAGDLAIQGMNGSSLDCLDYLGATVSGVASVFLPGAISTVKNIVSGAGKAKKAHSKAKQYQRQRAKNRQKWKRNKNIKDVGKTVAIGAGAEGYRQVRKKTAGKGNNCDCNK